MGKIKRFVKRLFGRKDSSSNELNQLIKKGLKIGQGSTIHAGCCIDSGWPWLISIGENVTISSNVTILAHDYSPNIVKCGTKLGKVVIGDNVFIGTRSVVLCGVQIGDNVVVGSGSIVTRDLPGNAVYAGCPAKRICSIEEYKEKYEELKNNSPSLDTIRPWDTWNDATTEEKEQMLKALENGIGFI